MKPIELNDGKTRKVKVYNYGSEGLRPMHVKDCPYGAKGSCISSSGSSACGGYTGNMISELVSGESVNHVWCGFEKPKKESK